MVDRADVVRRRGHMQNGESAGHELIEIAHPTDARSPTREDHSSHAKAAYSINAVDAAALASWPPSCCRQANSPPMSVLTGGILSVK